MSVQPTALMDVDEFLAWAESQPGKYELVDGVVFAMSPQRALRAEVKFSVQSALVAAIRSAGAPCRMLPDGMAVRIDAETTYEPDALVYCGDRVEAAPVDVCAPIIVVELHSPSKKPVDTGKNARGRFPDTDLDAPPHRRSGSARRHPTSAGAGRDE